MTSTSRCTLALAGNMAMRFFGKAVKASGVPEKVTIDKSGANKATIDETNAKGETLITFDK